MNDRNAALFGQAEHTFTNNIALDFAGAATERIGKRIEKFVRPITAKLIHVEAIRPEDFERQLQHALVNFG